MTVEVVLTYGGLLVSFTMDYESLESAQADWAYGPHACDCTRSVPLQQANILDHALTCNGAHPNQIGVVRIQPLRIH